MKGGSARPRADSSRCTIPSKKRGNAKTLSVLGSESKLNPDARDSVVRIRRKLKENHYLHGKAVYKRERLELTIPARALNNRIGSLEGSVNGLIKDIDDNFDVVTDR